MVAHRAFQAFLRDQKISANQSDALSSYTTFRCGGPARYFIEPRHVEEIQKILEASRECGVSYRMLGGGACLLVRDDGVDGAVIRLQKMRTLRIEGDLIHVEAGYPLPQLVKESVQAGLSGMECLAGIPGSVGGSLVMNAGGRHGEIGPLVKHVDVIREDGRVQRLPRHEIEFRYRSSSLAGTIVLGCALQLASAEEKYVRAKYDEVMAGKKATQPLGSPNAGCVFKNPPEEKAGRLIEACGLKGMRHGRAHVSRKHANFIINDGGCRSSDVLQLIDLMREQVAKQFSTELELEVTIW